VQCARGADHLAFGDGAHVVRVDVQANRHFARADAEVAGEAAQRFGQRDRGAAMQQPERLLRARIDRHRAAQPVVADLDHAHAEVFDHAAVARGIDRGEVGCLLPDRHGTAPAGRAADYKALP
jgi:hypothetical protein